MCDRSADTDFFRFLLLKIIGSNPVRMILSFEIELPLSCKFFLIDCIVSILLDVYIAIMIVLPERDLIRVGADHRPLFGIEVLRILLLVSHVYMFQKD